MEQVVEHNGKIVKLNKSGVWYYGEEYIVTNLDIVTKTVTTKSTSNEMQTFDFSFFFGELYESYFEF